MLLLWVRGGGFVRLMLDGEGSLINPFAFWSPRSERFLRKTRTLRESNHRPQNWLGRGGLGNGWGRPAEVVTEREHGQDCLPASAPALQAPNKMSAKSTLHCTDDRTHQSFSSPLNPLGYAGRLWDLCCIGIAEQKFIQFPHRQTLWITVRPPASDSPLWSSWLPPYVLWLRANVWVAKEAYHGLAMGA